jgi:opacity protein-like surface antigen
VFSKTMIKDIRFRTSYVFAAALVATTALTFVPAATQAQDVDFNDSLFDDSSDPLFQDGDGSLSIPDSLAPAPDLGGGTSGFQSQELADIPRSGEYNQYDPGVKPFPVETCDPLLVAVLTGSGYMKTSLDELYGGRASCGFVKAQLPPSQPPVNPAPDSTQVLEPAPDISLPDPTADADTDEGGLLGGLIPGSGFFTGLSNNLYLSVKAGYLLPQGTTVTSGGNSTTDAPDGGFGGSLAVGYKFNMNNDGFIRAIRAELEGNYSAYSQGNITIGGTTTTGGDTSLIGDFINAYADIGLGGIADISLLDQMGAYVGGGAGYVLNDTTYTGLGSVSGGSFAFQGMLGLNYKVSDQVTLGLGYRYLNVGAIEENGIKVDSRNHHIVEGSVVYSF